jgi:hypothetical protein
VVTVWEQAQVPSRTASTLDPYAGVYKGFPRMALAQGIYTFVDTRSVALADRATAASMGNSWGDYPGEYAQGGGTWLLDWELGASNGGTLYIDKLYFDMDGHDEEAGAPKPNYLSMEQGLRMLPFGPMGQTLIESCVAENNGKGGILASGQEVVNSEVRNNRGVGLMTSSTVGCVALNNSGVGVYSDLVNSTTVKWNSSDGIVGNYVSRSVVEANGGAGIIRIVDEQTPGRMRGQARSCLVRYNGGWGIYSQLAVDCDVLQNGHGINGDAANCRVVGNAGTGINSSGSLRDCEVRDNGGAGINSAIRIEGCRIVGNGSGLGYAEAISDSYIAANNGTGVTGSKSFDSNTQTWRYTTVSASTSTAINTEK